MQKERKVWEMCPGTLQQLEVRHPGSGGWSGGERGIRIRVRFLRSHRVMGENDAVKECGFISRFLSAQGPQKGGQATDAHITHHTACPSRSLHSPLYCFYCMCFNQLQCGIPGH